ncbi:hypothetical protein C5167_004038, partial [Papaver somniferum]
FSAGDEEFPMFSSFQLYDTSGEKNCIFTRFHDLGFYGETLLEALNHGTSNTNAKTKCTLKLVTDIAVTSLRGNCMELNTMIRGAYQKL